MANITMRDPRLLKIGRVYPYYAVRSWFIRAKEHYLAYRYTPEGRHCWYCGERNWFVDDCGYSYTHGAGKADAPTCRKCFYGWAGKWQAHWFGVGER